MATQSHPQAPRATVEDARNEPRQRVENALRTAARLAAPAATGALTAAVIASGDSPAWRPTLGVAAGVILGAAVAFYFAARQRFQEARPAAPPMNRIEQISGAAADAAAMIGGPAASLGEAIGDALRILERLPSPCFYSMRRGASSFRTPRRAKNSAAASAASISPPRSGRPPSPKRSVKLMTGASRVRSILRSIASRSARCTPSFAL